MRPSHLRNKKAGLGRPALSLHRQNEQNHSADFSAEASGFSSPFSDFSAFSPLSFFPLPGGAAGGALWRDVLLKQELEEAQAASIANAMVGELDDARVAAVAGGELGG